MPVVQSSRTPATRERLRRSVTVVDGARRSQRSTRRNGMKARGDVVIGNYGYQSGTGSPPGGSGGARVLRPSERAEAL